MVCFFLCHLYCLLLTISRMQLIYGVPSLPPPITLSPGGPSQCYVFNYHVYVEETEREGGELGFGNIKLILQDHLTPTCPKTSYSLILLILPQHSRFNDHCHILSLLKLTF